VNIDDDHQKKILEDLGMKIVPYDRIHGTNDKPFRQNKKVDGNGSINTIWNG